MSIVNQFRVWCETDNQWEFVWTDTEPAVCPVNGTHTITLDKTSIIKSGKADTITELTSDPTVNDDASKGFKKGSMIFTEDGEIFICKDSTVGAADWKKLPKNKTVSQVFQTGESGFVKGGNTDYTTIGSFVFEGTTKGGAPQKIKVVADKFNATSFDVRVQDSANGNVIAELTNQNSSGINILDMGSIGNLPSGETTFELQIKATGNGNNNKMKLYSMQMEF